jgi:hypothetical protein
MGVQSGEVSVACRGVVAALGCACHGVTSHGCDWWGVGGSRGLPEEGYVVADHDIMLRSNCGVSPHLSLVSHPSQA